MGVEYEGGYFFDSIIKDYDVFCVVCLILYFMFIMVFVRNVCFDGWYLEYNGYLMFNVYCYMGELDYICVDLYFDVIFNSQNNMNGVVLYMVESVCFGLFCLFYVVGREFMCVVCSK